MTEMNGKLTNWLFETGAVRVCSEGKPFWYTSGTLGPYYINTHFLFGGETRALKFIELIDEVKSDKKGCPGILLKEALDCYHTMPVYKGLMDSVVSFIRDNIDLGGIDLVSGGERRDWCFSLVAAELLGKPHMTIYKDLDAVVTKAGETLTMTSFSGMKILHIADLVTEASSYERAWVPAIEKLGAVMNSTVYIVDRMQGGAQRIESQGVKAFAMSKVDRALFEQARVKGLIGINQFEMVMAYLENPVKAMTVFLKNHPHYIQEALDAGGKSAERARLCQEKGFYGAV